MLERAINGLKINTIISHHFLKTSLHYNVKHKSFKMLQMLYQFLMTKLY